MIDKVLDLYQQYTGNILSPEQRKVYAPFAMRAVRMLESKLGWALDGGTDTVEVIGIAPNGCTCNSLSKDLKPAPEKVGIYRTYSIDTRKPNLPVDPFKKLNHVYFARIDMEAEIQTANGAIVLQEITDITPVFLRAGCGRYIKACHQMTACQQACEPNCTRCATLLVDADWVTIDDLPPELIFLICDYIDWMAKGGYASRWIRSESVDGHSVSYGSWITTAPYNHSADMAIIRAYTGPYGLINRKMIW